METVIVKIVPIVLCLILGIFFRNKGFILLQTIDDLKFIVINVALPPVLFQAFSRAEIALSLLTVPLAVSFCVFCCSA